MIYNEIELTKRYLNYSLYRPQDSTLNDNLWKIFNLEKSKKLFSLFGEKLIVEKEVSVKATFTDLVEKCKEFKIRETIMDAIGRDFVYFEADPATKSFIMEYLLDETSLARGTVSCFKSIVMTSKTLNKTLVVKDGTKISKLFKHFIADKSELEKIQIEYSKVFNLKEIKGTLCLSIHPLDCLTVSDNNHGWTSCFRTDRTDKGDYCASTLSLITSPNTIVVYFKSNTEFDLTPDAPQTEKIMWNSKKWRTYLTFDIDNLDYGTFSKQYPYENKLLLDEAKQMFSEMVNENYGKLFYDEECAVGVESQTNFYNDQIDGGNSYYAFIRKEAEPFDFVTIHLSERGSICPICGEHFDDIDHDIICGDCGGYRSCDYCGDAGLCRDEIYHVQDQFGDDVEVCQYCYDNETRDCDCCGERVYVQALAPILNEKGERIYVCSSCKNVALEQCSYGKCALCNIPTPTELLKTMEGVESSHLVCPDHYQKNYIDLL